MPEQLTIKIPTLGRSGGLYALQRDFYPWTPVGKILVRVWHREDKNQPWTVGLKWQIWPRHRWIWFRVRVVEWFLEFAWNL